MKLIILYETYVWLCKLYETLDYLVGIGRVGQHFTEILTLKPHPSLI